MSTIRDQHWTDVSKGGRNRTRTISNFINYWNKQKKQFDPVDLQIEDDQSTPPNWIGQFEFKYQIKRGNMQIYAHDLTKPNEAAVVGIRSARHPLYWMNIKALNANTTTHITDSVNNIIKWNDVWNNCDLQFQAARRKIIKLITLKTSDHPDYFDFSLKMNPAANIVENNGALDFIMAGKQQMQLISPYGWDSSDDSELNSNIKVDLSILDNSISKGHRYVKIRLIPDVNDLSGAIYPVFLDPTATISGTTDIEDNFIFTTVATKNFGSDTRLIVFTVGATAWTLIRIATIGSIPAGTITALKLFVNIVSGAGPDWRAYFVADANDWVEGTGPGPNGLVQAGSSCWNQCKHTVQNWAGSVGCAAAGTDYDVDASPPTLTTAAGWNTFTLDASWATAWRDGERASNGIIIFQDNSLDVRGDSVEESSNPLYFEIDYSAAVSGFTPAIALGVLKKKIL